MDPRRAGWLATILAPTALVLTLGGPLAAQEREPDAPVAEPVEEEPWSELTTQELVEAAWDAMRGDKRIRARELSEELLRRDPESIPGHCLLGVVLHRFEANLPLAVYHLRRCRRIIEERYGKVPFDDQMILWHATGLAELASVYGTMGRHEDKLRYLELHDQLYEPGYPADRGWPLMRLRRYDEAREVVGDALFLVDRPDQIATARTALCAIEAEQQRREEAYEACVLAAEMDRVERQGGPTPLANAAEASLGVLRFDEAERYLLDATQRFVSGTVSNPWLDLMHLYLTQGRISEALDAVRRMFHWRRRQPAYMDEQNRTETDLASAVFLILAGRAHEATRITERMLDRPDRTGFTSSETEQMEAANALVDSVAQHLAAEAAAEEASYLPFWDAWQARLRARRHASRSWSSGRRVAALLARERILLATVRPYLAGAMEIPEWVKPEIVAALGPGVVVAAVDEARARETLPEAEGYFVAYDAEAAYRRGRLGEALDLTDRAMNELPGAEVLLRARLAAVGAQAALEDGQRARAMELFDTALQIDPGVIRRLGLALPARVVAGNGEVARLAADLLDASPRFTAGEGKGFEVRVEGSADTGRACLVGPTGTLYACGEVTARAGDETPEDLARRLARELHAKAFAPRIDLTQADLRSLDGSPTAAGGRSSERLQQVLTDIVGGEN